MKKFISFAALFALLMTALCGCTLNIADENFSVGLGGVSNYTYKNASEYTAASDFSVDASVQSIKKIEIDWVSGDVTVKIADGDKIDVTETGAHKDDDIMRYRVSEGKLDIKWRAKGRYDSDLKKSVTIEIPESLMGNIEFDADLVSADIKGEGLRFIELSVDNVSGDVSFSDCTADEISIESVSGDVNIKGCTADELSVESVSGDINAGSSFKKGDFEVVSGSINAKCSDALKELDINSVSGDVTVVTDVKPASIKIDTLSGDISYYGEKKGSDDFEAENNGGAGKVKVETVSGDVEFSSSDTNSPLKTEQN